MIGEGVVTQCEQGRQKIEAELFFKRQTVLIKKSIIIQYKTKVTLVCFQLLENIPKLNFKTLKFFKFFEIFKILNLRKIRVSNPDPELRR